MQQSLFPTSIPLAVSYGMGVDSTAMLVEFARRAVRPDMILFADTGGEKDETYAYRPIIDRWLASKGFPTVTVVRYDPQDFKNWPPYHTLEENCLTNGTLPSLAFGFKSCSQKWKIAPQNKLMQGWGMAIDCWAAGQRVRKAIGFDAGPKDVRRRNHAGREDDKEYEYWYPLIEWGWDRERCKLEIAREGLPVPPKSSCFFCPAMHPAEVAALSPELLRRIVIMEARAKPRLEKIEGLWRNGVKGTRGGEKKPGMMTEFIREQGLLSAEEIERLTKNVPGEILARNDAHKLGDDVGTWEQFLSRSNAGRISLQMADEKCDDEICCDN